MSTLVGYASPVEQEAARGHKLLSLGADTYLEVAVFKGKVYASMRRWYKADDDVWYRTKNGLSLLARDMLTIMRDALIVDFIELELANPWHEE